MVRMKNACRLRNIDDSPYKTDDEYTCITPLRTWMYYRGLKTAKRRLSFSSDPEDDLNKPSTSGIIPNQGAQPVPEGDVDKPNAIPVIYPKKKSNKRKTISIFYPQMDTVVPDTIQKMEIDEPNTVPVFAPKKKTDKPNTIPVMYPKRKIDSPNAVSEPKRFKNKGKGESNRSIPAYYKAPKKLIHYNDVIIIDDSSSD